MDVKIEISCDVNGNVTRSIVNLYKINLD